MRKVFLSLILTAAAAHLAVAPLAYSTPAYALAGDVTLPNPYVSRALDAVLLPIDAVVRTTFALDAKDQGVLVLSVQPDGVADQQGIEPGDVISQVRGHTINDPIELDEVVYYWINQGAYDFSFDYYRAGVLASTLALITLELYSEVFDIATIASWESWSTATSFSYAEFYSEYSSVISSSYESSQTTIEETVASEEFASEVTEEDAFDDEDGDGIDDAADTDDDNDGIDDAADTDDDNDGIDDAADTDDDNDGIDDAAEDDGGDEGDDGGDDVDDGGDEGGDDGGEE